ncbi:hypothetical protein [Chitinimonas sp.]|uniref:ribosome modulation factor n=1 Tax=Chitinimonas sp. TaxID=1934313 RepID=UPI0035B10D94
MTILTAVVEQLYARAFGPNVARDPRSRQYREGVHAALSNRIAAAPFAPPYSMGTVDADAWFAGWDEGVRLSREYGGEVPA